MNETGVSFVASYAAKLQVLKYPAGHAVFLSFRTFFVYIILFGHFLTDGKMKQEAKVNRQRSSVRVQRCELRSGARLVPRIYYHFK